MALAFSGGTFGMPKAPRSAGETSMITPRSGWLCAPITGVTVRRTRQSLFLNVTCFLMCQYFYSMMKAVKSTHVIMS